MHTFVGLCNFALNRIHPYELSLIISHMSSSQGTTEKSKQDHELGTNSNEENDAFVFLNFWRAFRQAIAHQAPHNHWNTMTSQIGVCNVYTSLSSYPSCNFSSTFFQTMWCSKFGTCWWWNDEGTWGLHAKCPQCKLLLLKSLATTKEGERELSYMSEYLSSIQHMDMGPYRIVAYSSQKTWTRLIMNCWY